jgi:NAD(P)-dependent dehydrogenase (short-subunit alcohol dehydrogenase family)
LENKVVLITGAAGGLGKALVMTFATAGWQVIATDIRTVESSTPGSGILYYPMDVTSGASVGNAAYELSIRYPVIDLIINNAGMDRYFPLSEVPAELLKQIFEVNFFGACRVNQAFLPILKTPGGRIIHITSESFHLTGPFMPYPLTKRLLESYARSLRIELGFRGIDVITIRPGAIETPLLGVVRNLEATTGNWQLEKEFRQFAAMASREIGKVVTPEAAAAFILRVAGKKNPRRLYLINNMLKLRIAALLPFFVTERIMKAKLRK